MRVLGRLAARLPEEDHEDLAACVERGHKRGNGQRPEHDHVAAVPRVGQDFILGPEPRGDERETREGQPTRDEGPRGAGHLVQQAAHQPHVVGVELDGQLLVPVPVLVGNVVAVVHGVDHRARAQEEERLEEGVHEQVEGRGDVSTDAQGREHVAQLGNGRVGQDALDVELGDADGGRKEGGEGADEGHEPHGAVAPLGHDVEEGEGADDQVHARGHHRRRVDERAHGGGAFHSIGQPDVERELGRLADGTPEDEDGKHRGPGRDPEDGHGHDLVGQFLQRLGGQDFAPAQGARHGVEEHHAREHDGVAHARGDKGLDGGRARPLHLSLINVRLPWFAERPEPDEQVGAHAHQFPEDKGQKQIIRQDEPQHSRGKEGQVSEEAAEPRIALHVPHRVHEDKETEEGDHEQHDRG